jgi:hypothetical protein
LLFEVWEQQQKIFVVIVASDRASFTLLERSTVYHQKISKSSGIR